ncbi:hypothetical protein [Ureibacillus aquaedulcis]|uniref:Lipoprotein n=1 Tax=Ureibacillus aquaedulcis TaxID=3058421 RepID=A0ABT8GS53_9BACL|nr:hypothetical protein [Ureibacillus sp. BA0131]MDN4494084.1 hypothetical protein [Ureibacillus sp. BA0131]
MKKLSLFLSLAAFVFLVGCSDNDSKKEETTPEESVVKEESPSTDKKTETKSETETITKTETDTTTTDSGTNLAEDFTLYIDEIILLAPEEDRIIGLYDGVTGTNYTNDEVLYNTLFDEIVPSYREFVVELESIMPQNERIRELHELYIDAANIQYNSFTLMLSALEEQDMDKVTEANQGLDKARALLRDWLYEVEAISVETGVSLQ